MTTFAPPRLRRTAAAALGALGLAVAGCTVLPGSNQPPPRLFVLTPKSTFRPDLPKVDWQLTIAVPIAEAGLNTARIAVRRSPVSLEYFERANWIDTAPRMIQTLMVESFENSRRIVGVGRRSVALRADYSLLTELREFQAEYDGKRVPAVRVRLNAKLVRMPARAIVATTSVENSVTARSAALEDVVRAFDAALGKALKRLVTWTLTAVPPTRPDRARPRR